MAAHPQLGLAGPAEDVWTVTQVAQAVKRRIEHNVAPFWVRAELGQFKAYGSGHWYFTLCDERTQMRCCMWRTHVLKAGKPPAEGTRVFAFGMPSLWEEKAELRFIVTTLLPGAAVGQAQLELERIKSALQKDGLLDPARKRPLPAFPSTLAVVTSRDGAALRDIVHVARRRWPLCRILVLGARVQGAEAGEEIVCALPISLVMPNSVSRTRRQKLRLAGSSTMAPRSRAARWLAPSAARASVKGTRS